MDHDVLLALIALVGTALGVISWQIKSHSKTTDRFADLVEKNIITSNQQANASEKVAKATDKVAENLQANTAILKDMKKKTDILTPLMQQALLKKKKK